MADIKISELTATAAIDGSEDLPVVDSGATKKTKVRDVAKVGHQDIVTDATAARTLGLGDIGAWLRFTSTSTVTVPDNATVAFQIGTTLNGVQAGTGQVTLVGAGGVTINKPVSYTLKTREQGSAFSLIKVATDAWDLVGDLEAMV